jgi:F-type H+-transporting ATPase subunit a
MNFLLASGDNPLGHVVDKPMYGVKAPESWSAWRFTQDPGVPVSCAVIIFSGLLVCFLLWRAAKAIQTGPESQGTERFIAQGRLGQFVESIVVGLRDQMLVPVMGEAQTRRYLPFLLSLFFFLLVVNLFGLMPFADIQHMLAHNFVKGGAEEFILFGGTATANLMVTGGLAAICFCVIQIHSFRELGLGGWLEHLCGGSDLVRGPKGLYLVIPVIFVVEFLGMFIKPIALAIRLFANMVGGHTLMATLLMFGMMAAKGGLATWAVGTISVASGTFALIILFLEVFVAFLQAFIFMFLTAVFISTMSHHDEEHGEDHHEEHGHATAEAHH